MWIALAIIGLLVVVSIHDMTQTRHAIRRNFPVIGHFRYWLESVGPELRQYIVTSNTEERPFSRAQRRWVYASAKGQNNYFAFGTDEPVESAPNFLIVKHVVFGDSDVGTPPDEAAAGARRHWIPAGKILGGARGRRLAFRPQAAVYVSGMSFGSLSGPAVEALNRGSAIAGCMHNTGEGGVGPHHDHGAELMWQLGTGYFGARDAFGRYSEEQLLERVARYPVRAIEIKLSQGGKPGLGGVLPAAKVSPEIARVRGVPVGQDCISPSRHSAFRDPDSMLDFVERIAEQTGLPVGIKSAVGDLAFWSELAALMARGDRGVDFITIDGGEGGTGAAPLVFADHVALPFNLAFSRVYRVFAEAGVAQRVVWIGSGKLGFPESTLFGFALGCDMVAVAREAMMAIGCIQAQRCHTGHCPAGVATQNRWLMRGLDPTDKAARLANYMVTLRKEVLQLSHTCGVAHPGLVTGDHLELLDGHFGSRTVESVFGYERGWGMPAPDDRERLITLLRRGGEDVGTNPSGQGVEPARRSA